MRCAQSAERGSNGGGGETPAHHLSRSPLRLRRELPLHARLKSGLVAASGLAVCAPFSVPFLSDSFFVRPQYTRAS